MISIVQLETLIELGYSYSTIARVFGVSERMILRRRLEYDLPIGITDNDLDVSQQYVEGMYYSDNIMILH